MGNDGGSIIKGVRIRVVDDASKNAAKAKKLEYYWNDLWSNCRLLGTPLMPPLFSDCKGNLFNKESILEWLLVKPEYKSEEYTQVVIDAFSHIKSRKDLVELTNLQELGNGTLGVSLSGTGTTTTDLVLGNRRKFGYIDTCGHVNTLSALDNGTGCYVCGTSYTRLNIVVLNPTEQDDVQRLVERQSWLQNQNLLHSRKPRKRKSDGKPLLSSRKKQKSTTTTTKDIK